jgi:hypothetical protein
VDKTKLFEPLTHPKLNVLVVIPALSRIPAAVPLDGVLLHVKEHDGGAENIPAVSFTVITLLDADTEEIHEPDWDVIDTVPAAVKESVARSTRSFLLFDIT